jgi:hypothetical protein
MLIVAPAEAHLCFIQQNQANSNGASPRTCFGGKRAMQAIRTLTNRAQIALKIGLARLAAFENAW